MNRRAFLAVLAAAGAGCTGGPGTGGDGTSPTTSTTTDGTTTTRTTATTTAGTTRGTVTDPPSVTAPPEVGPFESAAAVPCPPVGDGQTTCSHTVSDTAGAVYFTPTAPRLERPADTATFTLHNDTDRRFGMNPYGWTVMKRVGDGWRHVAPSVYPQPWTTVQSGETFQWTFGFGDASVEGERMGDAVHLDHLGPGTFAFYIGGLLGEDGEDRATALIPFAVTGDPLALTPGDVTGVERRDDTLAVSTRRGARTEHPSTVEFTRVEGVENPGQLLTEHALGLHPVRNGLPYLVDDESLGAVRVATTDPAASTAERRLGSAFRDPTTESDGPSVERAFRYAGTTFVMTVHDEPDDPTTDAEKTHTTTRE